jgi:hypothetical protein
MLRLRVLEILSPVTSNTPPDDYIPSTAIAEPRPGMFLSRKRDNRRLEPWALSLSRKDGHAAIFRDFIAERALEKEKYGV